MVDKWGTDIESKLNSRSAVQYLMQCEGIKKPKAEKIKQAWDATQGERACVGQRVCLAEGNTPTLLLLQVDLLMHYLPGHVFNRRRGTAQHTVQPLRRLLFCCERPLRLEPVQPCRQLTWRCGAVVLLLYCCAAGTREGAIFLKEHGISLPLAQRVAKRHGPHTVARVKRDAYHALAGFGLPFRCGA
jgi:hypothetical protein